MRKRPEITPMGSQAVLLEFDPEISLTILEDILNLSQWIEQSRLKVKVEVVSAYNSLLIRYLYPIEDIYSELEEIQQLIETAPAFQDSAKSLIHIPVCYDENFAIDLELVSKRNKLEKEEVVHLHSLPLYTVYFIGFLPGFMYLGGLDERLVIPRKSHPRKRIEKGAVGIGEKQTGIYPQVSPGGWQIIGNSPVPLFEPQKMPPCSISPGDKVKFYPIDLATHQQLSEDVRTGKFHFEREQYHGKD